MIVVGFVALSSVQAQDYTDRPEPSGQNYLDYDNPAATPEKGWKRLGCKWADYDEDRLVFRLGRNFPRFKTIQVRVASNRPYVLSGKIISYHGDRHRFEVDSSQSLSGQAITIRFSRSPRRVRKIILNYDAKMRPGDRVRICVSRQSGRNNSPFLSAEKKKHPKWRPVERNWVGLGCLKAGKRYTADYIRVGAKRGRFRAIRLKIRRSPAMIKNLDVTLGNGSKKNLDVRPVLSVGQYSKVFYFGKAQTISVVDIETRSRSLFMKSQICLEGLKGALDADIRPVEPEDRNDQERDNEDDDEAAKRSESDGDNPDIDDEDRVQKPYDGERKGQNNERDEKDGQEAYEAENEKQLNDYIGSLETQRRAAAKKKAQKAAKEEVEKRRALAESKRLAQEKDLAQAELEKRQKAEAQKQAEADRRASAEEKRSEAEEAQEEKEDDAQQKAEEDQEQKEEQKEERKAEQEEQQEKSANQKEVEAQKEFEKAQKQARESYQKAQEKAKLEAEKQARAAQAAKDLAQGEAEAAKQREQAQRQAELEKQKSEAEQQAEALRQAEAQQKREEALRQEKAEQERLAEIKRLAAKKLAEQNKVHSNPNDFPKRKISPGQKGWIRYGCQDFGTEMKELFIPVGRMQDTFTKIRIKVISNALTLKKMTVIYGNGRQEPLVRYSSRIKVGSYSSEYKLSHRRRYISEVRLKAQARDARNENKARVCLEAYR